jgi:hypothetical protein
VHGREFVARKTAGDFVFQVPGSWTCEVFQVETGSAYHLGEKDAFGGAVGVEMGVASDSLN